MPSTPFEIVNQPVFLEREAYDAQVNAFVEQARGCNGLIGIFMMGWVGAPGLSDLDLVCVVKDDVRDLRPDKLSVKQLDRNIFLHGPLIVPESLVADLRYIVYPSNRVDVLGDCSKQVGDLGPDDSRALALAYVVDVTEVRLVQYATDSWQRRLNKRHWMARLWSFTHTRELCRQTGLEVSETFGSFVEALQAFRANWLEGQPLADDRFLELYTQSKAMAEEIFSRACEMSARIIGTGKADNGPWVFSGRGKTIECSANTTTPSAERVVRRPPYLIGRRRKSAITRAPAAYARHLRAYGFQCEPQLTCDGSTEYARILRRRAEIVHRHQLFLDSMGIRGSQTGHLGLPVPALRS